MSGPAWTKYPRHPEIPLFTHDDDAIGFYAHPAESCVNLWMIMLRAAEHGDKSAYDEATSQPAELFLDSWASDLFRDASLGHEWDTAVPPAPSV